MLSRFLIEPIKQSKLESFFKDQYSPAFDLPNTEEIFKNTFELAFDNEDAKATTVIHACYDQVQEKYCAFINIGTTTQIDDIASLAIEYIFIESDYRKVQFHELGNMKLSEYLLLDYTIGTIGFNVKEQIGIHVIGLVPVNEKVREIYENMGFISLPKSGSHENEDWMIFNI